MRVLRVSSQSRTVACVVKITVLVLVETCSIYPQSPPMVLKSFGNRGLTVRHCAQEVRKRSRLKLPLDERGCALLFTDLLSRWPGVTE